MEKEGEQRELEARQERTPIQKSALLKLHLAPVCTAFTVTSLMSIRLSSCAQRWKPFAKRSGSSYERSAHMVIM